MRNTRHGSKSNSTQESLGQSGVQWEGLWAFRVLADRGVRVPKKSTFGKGGVFQGSVLQDLLA